MEKFVFHVPKWQGELFFSKEVLVFAGAILLMIVGALFCFWGYKYFKTILFLGIGMAAGCGSYLLAEAMTPNLVIRMFLTVSLTFLGVCFAYFLDIVFGYILDRLHIRGALGKRTYLAAAPLGALILGLTIYHFIWRDGITAAVIALVCLVVGLPVQYANRKKQVRFQSYNDLLRLSRAEVCTEGRDDVVLGSVASLAGAAAAASKPEVEPAAEPVMEEAGQKAESAAEPVMEEAGQKVEPAAESAAEEVKQKADESASDLLVIQMQPERRPMQELPTELSDAAIEQIHKKMDAGEDILEDAFFVKLIQEYAIVRHHIKQLDVGLAAMAASRHEEMADVTAAQLEVADVMNKVAEAMNKAAEAMSKAAEAVPEADTEKKQGRKKRKKQGRKQDKRLMAGAVAAVVGVSAFLAGRASKGGD